MSDRIAGILIVLFALFYGLEALRLKSGFASGPIGPKEFPLILAAALVVTALFLLFTVDPEPDWPLRSSWLNLGVVVASFVAYAYLLVPTGFIAATTLATGLVSQRFGAKAWQALVTGFVASLALYVLFVYALGIPLPVGKIFGAR